MVAHSQYRCSLLFVLAIVLCQCHGKRTEIKGDIKSLDDEKAKEVHDAVSQLLEHKIGKKLKEAAKEVKHAVDSALGKHLHNADNILKHKDADVIVMDPKLSKLVKNAVKEGHQRHHQQDVHHAAHVSHAVPHPHAPQQGPPTFGTVQRPNYPGYGSTVPGALSNPYAQQHPGVRAYPGNPVYATVPGHPASPAYPATQGYHLSAGYAAVPGSPGTPAPPVSPGCPAAPGCPPSPGNTQAKPMPVAFDQAQPCDGMGGCPPTYGVPAPPSVMGAGCPQPCNQNCYFFCPTKCCGGDKRTRVTRNKKTKHGKKAKKRTMAHPKKGKKEKI